jgi:hypothetical protein
MERCQCKSLFVSDILKGFFEDLLETWKPNLILTDIFEFLETIENT